VKLPGTSVAPLAGVIHAGIEGGKFTNRPDANFSSEQLNVQKTRITAAKIMAGLDNMIFFLAKAPPTD
jgi:hypothetical protein